MIIFIIFALLIKSLLFFLLPGSSNYLLEITIFLSTIYFLNIWKKSSGIIFLFLFSPIFLWPGSILPKFGIFLLTLSGWLFTKSKILSLVILFFSLAIFIKPATSLPLFHNPAISATINQFRGEDQKFGFVPFARLLHNKIAYFSVFTSAAMQDLNLSNQFGLGDKVETSLNQWIPPLLIPTLFLLLISLINWRASSKFYWLLGLLGFLLGVISAPNFVETNFFLFYISLIFIAGTQLDHFNHSQSLKIFSLILLLPMILFSIVYRPRPLLIASNYGQDKFVSYAIHHSNKTIYLSNNLYTHLDHLPHNLILLPVNDARFLPPVDENTILMVPSIPPQPKNSGYTPQLTIFLSDYSRQPLLYTLIYVKN